MVHLARSSYIRTTLDLGVHSIRLMKLSRRAYHPAPLIAARQPLLLATFLRYDWKSRDEARAMWVGTGSVASDLEERRLRKASERWN